MRVKCYQCFRPRLHCLCSSIPKIDTKIKFIILIHPKEAKKERLGTGRIVKQALLNSEMIMGVDFTTDPMVNHYLDNQKFRPFLMYPGEAPQKVAQFKDQLHDPREIIIFILDGTWPFAKKMLRKSKNLQTIPRITITIKGESNFRIKQQPDSACLCTLEAVVQFLDECEESELEKLNGVQKNLLETFEKLVKFQEDCALDPNKQGYRKGEYKTSEQKTPSKKWLQYGIFYKG